MRAWDWFDIGKYIDSTIGIQMKSAGKIEITFNDMWLCNEWSGMKEEFAELSLHPTRQEKYSQFL